MNPVNLAHLYRDFYAIHLLFARDNDPYLNAEAVVHLWYSAKLTQVLWDHIYAVMGVYFQEFNDSIEEVKSDQPEDESSDTPADQTISMGWIRKNVHFLGSLFKAQWILVRNVLVQKTNPSPEEASNVRKLDQQRHCEPLTSVPT